MLLCFAVKALVVAAEAHPAVAVRTLVLPAVEEVEVRFHPEAAENEGLHIWPVEVAAVEEAHILLVRLVVEAGEEALRQQN